jgi:5-methyltetrahydrofolate--homocysteine methyltransferase
MADFTSIRDAVLAGNPEPLIDLVKKFLIEKVPPKEILSEGLIKGMDIVGEKMQDCSMFIPEVLMSARCMAEALAVLKPELAASDMGGAGKVVFGTVKGDLHDIGKNLVIMMLEGAGFEVVDLGVDVKPETFVEAVKTHHPDIMAMSALLTTTMPSMKATIALISKNGLRDNVRIIVGGAPVSRRFSEEIGADGYANDAGSATKLARALLQ